MNYIQEINAFYVHTETNPLSVSAANLWHTLMHVNNRARWVKDFSVAASVLCSKSGLSLSTFKRARKELCEKGYLMHTPRGTKAPLYRVVSLVDVLSMTPMEESPEMKVNQQEKMDQEVGSHGVDSAVLTVQQEACDHQLQRNDTQVNDSEKNNDKGLPETCGMAEFEEDDEVSQMIENYLNGISIDDVGEGMGQQLDQEESQDMNQLLSPLYKQKDNKRKQNDTSTNRTVPRRAYDFYQNHFGKPSNHIERDMVNWAEALGDDLLFAALERTVENGKTTWGYTVGILRKWKQAGLRTIDDVQTAEATFRNKRLRQGGSGHVNFGYGGSSKKVYGNNRYRHVREEVVPDWFKEHQEEKRLMRERRLLTV